MYASVYECVCIWMCVCACVCVSICVCTVCVRVREKREREHDISLLSYYDRFVVYFFVLLVIFFNKLISSDKPISRIPYKSLTQSYTPPNHCLKSWPCPDNHKTLEPHRFVAFRTEAMSYS